MGDDSGGNGGKMRELEELARGIARPDGSRVIVIDSLSSCARLIDTERTTLTASTPLVVTLDDETRSLSSRPMPRVEPFYGDAHGNRRERRRARALQRRSR